MKKNYKTKEGHEVFLVGIAYKSGIDYPVVGFVKYEDKWLLESWTLEGMYDEGCSGFNLVEVKKRVEMNAKLEIDRVDRGLSKLIFFDEELPEELDRLQDKKVKITIEEI